MEEYIVQYGDTLKTIAKQKLTDESRWFEIAQLNGIKSPYQLYVGVRIKLPSRFSVVRIPPPPNVKLQPAWIIPARGFIFVVFEQLPEVGSKNVLRKVQVIPTDFNLVPKNPSANYSLAEHARKGDILDTQLLSASNKPYGSPTGKVGDYKDVLLIDTQQAMAKGSRVYSVEEVVKDLRRYAAIEPNNEGLQESVKTLIRTIEKVEGEVIIENGVHGNAVRKISSNHTPYIKTADEIWAAHKAGKITLEQAEKELATVAKAYERARIVGRVGRVLTVVGVVLTAVDMGVATKTSIDKGSFRSRQKAFGNSAAGAARLPVLLSAAQ